MKNSSIPAIAIWVLYGLTAGCCLFLTAMIICSDRGTGEEIGLAIGAAVLLVLGGISFGIGHIKKLQKRAAGGSKGLAGIVAESLIVVALLVFMVVIRTVLFENAVLWNIDEDPTYTLAQVGAGEMLPNIAHRGRELYAHLLRGSMFFFGNKPQSAVTVQMVLLVLAGLSLYFGIRKSAGTVAAVMTVAFLGLAPYMLVETCKISAFLLVLIVYGLGVGAISGLPGKTKENKIVSLLYCLWTGVLIGLCCYLDMSGITLLVLLTGTICFGKDEGSCADDNEKEAERIGNQILIFLMCVFAAAAGYFLCHAIRSIGGGTIVSSVNGQLTLYLPERFGLPIPVDVGVTLWDMPVLAALMAVGIFSFWISFRIRTRGIWLFTAALLFIMQCLKMNDLNSFDSYGLLYLVCVVMAGISVGDLFLPKQNAEEELVMDMPKTDEYNTEEHTAAPASDVNAGIGKELEKVDLDSDQVVAPVVQYIENPLPLPKKKAHKAMDYDYEVSEEDDFDIP